MRILGFDVRRTAKSYSVRDLAKDVGFGFGGPAPLDPWKVITEAYAGNATVFTACTRIAGAAASVPWIPQVLAKDGNATDLPADHALVRMLARPTKWHAWPQLMEAVIGSLVLFGEAYVYLNGPGNPKTETGKNPGPPPTEAIWVPTQWVEPQYNEQSMEVIAYRVNTRDGVMEIPAHRMVAALFWNPATPWRGQGRVRAAAMSIDTVNLGRKWNRNLLTKGARPPGVLETDQTLSEPIYQRLRLDVERNLAGADNAGKPPILEGGVRWKATGMSATDMEFQDGMREAKREIAVALGADPSIIGDPMTKTFANYSEARMSLYQDTVLPILDLFRLCFEARMRAWYPDVSFLLDTDAVPALMESKRNAWKGLADLVEKGLLTRNEARRAMGFDDVDGGDEILVPLAVVPLREAVTPAAPIQAPPPAAPAKPGKPGSEDAYAEG